ncbi:MAG: tyrosine-type recombinase/integrase [Planctomycetes bacterium]|nr:tyrosine-type recombinase/integrase [Planctomycetota bacterium]
MRRQRDDDRDVLRDERGRVVATLFKRRGDPRYRVRYKDGTGVWREAVATRAKPEALAYMADLRRRVLEGEADRRDPFAKWAAIPLVAHLTDFIATLEGRGRSETHVHDSRKRLERIVEACGWRRLEDIAPEALDATLKRWRDEGLGAVTSNSYLTAAKAFERWLVEHGRLLRRRLACLRPAKVVEPRHQRRALSAAEVGLLLRATEASPRRVYAMDGRTRALIYSVALGTGLRTREIAALKPEDFQLARVPTAVFEIRASIAKNGRRVLLPLRKDLAAALRPVLAQAAPERPIFPGSWRWSSGKMLRTDLEAAGIPYWTHDGVCDFHALRHSFVSNLVRNGVGVKAAQLLARHSSPVLTLNVYSHLNADELAPELEKTARPPEQHDDHNETTKAAG